MKKIKKLVLNKSMISNLNKSEMSQLGGGYQSQQDPVMCHYYSVGPLCPPPPLNTHEVPCASGNTCPTWSPC